jgi:hypothetical protein
MLRSICFKLPAALVAIPIAMMLAAVIAVPVTVQTGSRGRYLATTIKIFVLICRSDRP